MTIEHIECKAAITVDEEGTIEVLAWPFGSPDVVGDMIEPTAEIKIASPLPALWHHDPSKPIGVWDRVEITARGIEAKGRLLLDGERARAVRTLILDKGASGVSIGFNETKATRRNPRGRTIHGLTLREISVTPTPCHPGATVLTAKAIPATSEGSSLENETTEAAPDSAAITALESRLAAVEKKSLDRLDKIEAKLARPAIVTSTTDEPVERKAFANYLRVGARDMDPVEKKALSVSTDTSGGYLAPEQFTLDFIRDLVPFSPIRAIADVRSTNSHSVTMPKRTAITNAKWKGEAATMERSEPAFDQLEITVKELTTEVVVNNQLIEDSRADVDAEVRLALSEDFGAKESLAFVNGVGGLEPDGFMKNTDIAATLNGHATNLSADALIKLMYAMPATYRNRGTWVLNGTTLAAIRTLKDTTGSYIWQPSYQAGQPESILGRPVVEAEHMPDLAANATPIMFGDFKTAYRIYDRLDLSIFVNPYLLASNRQTVFHAFRRVGAGVVQPKALRGLKMATA
ncbi:phage major capsid protein [Aurantimonas sp. 22II-16-19i]|uniref:phage major capsid protein n=1 Tax=Aurantimonas sp. 22II-16-19i TaxID=1317114 RepID=UPI0009F7F3EB|nr:phage major capsid protein [Aurantimonas sp. 22II-16-19i]ORE90145.1 hypothetical protein ATO4_22022 [Aurantimonas sp. 22II-16-19i]